LNGKANGYGEYFFKSGKSTGSVYKGNWENGKMNGHGELISASGNIYRGNYENGKK
jgi:hypothetical protein